MPTVISPATLSFSGSVPRNVQCSACGVPPRLGPISSLSLCCRSNLVRPACRRFTPWQPRRRYARFFGKDYNGTIGHRLDAIGADLLSDPDGHTVEYITLLDEAPECEFVGSLSAWKARQKI